MNENSPKICRHRQLTDESKGYLEALQDSRGDLSPVRGLEVDLGKLPR